MRYKNKKSYKNYRKQEKNKDNFIIGLILAITGMAFGFIFLPYDLTYFGIPWNSIPSIVKLAAGIPPIDTLIIMVISFIAIIIALYDPKLNGDDLIPRILFSRQFPNTMEI